MAVAGLGSFGGRWDADAKLAWAVVVGTLPVAIAGFVIAKDSLETQLRGPLTIATATILFGLALWWADAAGKRRRDEHQIGWGDAVLIGLAQALALIPGTSRSGITITAGLALGLTRAAAARFSFLLSIPAILGSGVLLLQDLLASPAPVAWGNLTLGTAVAALSAYACIHFFLKLLERTGMLPYVIYRLLLGGVLLLLFWR